MKIRIAHNATTFDGGMEISPEEIGGKMGLERVRMLSEVGITVGTDILKKYPDIRQITLDTMTDEEREMINQSLSDSGGKA